MATKKENKTSQVYIFGINNAHIVHFIGYMYPP